MSDDIELVTGDYVPIQETVCECGHPYDEHVYGTACEAASCVCANFVAGWEGEHVVTIS